MPAPGLDAPVVSLVPVTEYMVFYAQVHTVYPLNQTLFSLCKTLSPITTRTTGMEGPCRLPVSRVDDRGRDRVSPEGKVRVLLSLVLA